jgi:hypothetical protein
MKFLTDWVTYVKMRSQIQPFVALDKYAPAGGRYSLLSLYYDSPGYDCYYDKIDGNDRRHKFRIRWYLDQEGVRKTAFLELKKKVNYGTFKKRLMVNNDVADDFIKGKQDCIKRICADPRQHDIANEMLFYCSAQKLQPVVYTHYLREAYIGKCENRLRITFDMKISCKPGRDRDFDFVSKRYIFNPYYMVLEIKGFHDMPYWLISIINNNNLQRQNISKYCMAVEAANLLI